MARQYDTVIRGTLHTADEKKTKKRRGGEKKREKKGGQISCQKAGERVVGVHNRWSNTGNLEKVQRAKRGSVGKN